VDRICTCIDQHSESCRVRWEALEVEEVDQLTVEISLNVIASFLSAVSIARLPWSPTCPVLAV
jgi:hypothetical protein